MASSNCNIMLIYGYCRISSSIEINDDDIISVIGLYLPFISHDTRRAIASAHFFAETIYKFQNNVANKCPFVENKSDGINLLNYAYVRGGALRDITLYRNINDIDIVIDYDKLSKAYNQHLHKYHSEIHQQSLHSPCFAWRRYLNMYKAESSTTNEQIFDDTEDSLIIFGNNIIRSNFLLNALFFKDILIMSSSQNQNNLFEAIPTFNCTKWVVKIRETLIYKGINLKSARIDICDEMDQCEGIKTDKLISNTIDSSSVLEWSECFEYIQDLKYRINNDNAHNFHYCDDHSNEPLQPIKNEKCKQIGKNYEIIRNELSELIHIELPNYTFLMNYSTQFCDFTLNGIRLPLSLIYADFINFDWRRKILHYSNMNDLDNLRLEKHNRLSIKHIKNRIICQPHLGILSLDYVYNDYFWRCIKLIAKFNGHCVVDKKTKKILRRSWKAHFGRLNGMKMRSFWATFCIWRISKNHKFEEYVRRLTAMQQIGFDKDLKNALRKHSIFAIVLDQVLKKKLRKSEKINGVYKALQLFGYKLENPQNKKRELIVKNGYKYCGKVFLRWFKNPIYTSSKTNAFDKTVSYWKGKECKRLFVNNFDVNDKNTHKEFTKLFYSFGDLCMDPIFEIDANGDPFAIVHFQFLEDAIRCFDQHNYSYDYLRFGKYVLFIDYDRDLKRKKKKKREKIVYDSDSDDCDYKKWAFKCL